MSTAAPTPATPGTPSTTPPAKGPEGYFNSSRLKVIGMITAATVAVGALGGIAGVVFDPDPISTELEQLDTGGEGGLGSPGNAAPRGAAAKPISITGFAGAGGLRADGTESPSPVGSVSPGTGGFSSSPTDEPTETTEPSPTDDGGTGGTGGTAATITATDVDIFVPPNWEVTFQDENNVGQTNGAGGYAFAYSTTVDPSISASDVIAQNMDVFLPQDSYTQLQTGDITALQPFGSVVSAAGLGYQAVWVDNQGSISLAGQMYVGIRQDGTLLVIIIEQLPAEAFVDAQEELMTIINNSFAAFGGVG